MRSRDAARCPAFDLSVATLLLVAGKLFQIDLFRVGAVWRILLFMSFGGLFIALGYFVRGLWMPSQKPRPEAVPSPPGADTQRCFTSLNPAVAVL